MYELMDRPGGGRPAWNVHDQGHRTARPGGLSVGPPMRNNGGMPLKVSISAACIFLGGLLWAGRLLFGPSPWSASAASLTAAGLILISSVTATAALLSPGRWVRNSTAAAAAVWASIAAASPVDPLWTAAAAAGGAGAVLAWSRPLDGWFRRAAPDRVPPKAAALALGLIWLPCAVGGLGLPDVTTGGWVLAAFGAAGGWAYARALPGALWTVRVALPAAGVAAAVGLHLAAAAGLLAAAGALTWLAWTADARRAAAPPAPRRVKPVSVPPEAAPPGLLESAGYDRRGRPLRRRG